MTQRTDSRMCIFLSLFLCSLYTIVHPKGDCVGLGTPKAVHLLPV